MLKIHINLIAFLAALTIMCISGCKKYSKLTNASSKLSIWEIDDPPGLNPLLTFDATSTEIRPLLFQSLLNFSYDDYSLIPVLAKSRPGIELLGDTAMVLHYKIRPKARWDNGSHVTARDVLFSYKAIASPVIAADYLKPYLQMVDHIEIDPSDSLSLRIYTKEVHIRAEASTGFEIPILPEYFYDPDHLLRAYSFRDLYDMDKSTDPNLIKWGERFSSPEFARLGDSMSGSGGYRLQRWDEGERIVLKKKEQWWGSKIKDTSNMYFDAHPEKIIYQIINDQTAALTALKGGQLDVMRSVKARDFKSLLEDSGHQEKLKLFTPPMLAFSALGINMKSPLFENRTTRQAIAYLIDYDRLMQDVMYGFAERCIGPVYPSLKKYYNDSITPYRFNPDKAQKLLQISGWTDHDGDGWLDRMIYGEKIDFEFDFITNKGQEEREKVALIVQENLRKAGIRMNIVSLEWGLVLKHLFDHDFDMMYISMVGDPAPEDYSQLWGRASQNGGYNFVNFGTAYSDSLIAKINHTLDEDVRAGYIRELQVLIHEEVPYVFLWTPENRIAIRHSFGNMHISAYRPGFWPASFILAAD